MDKKIKVGIIGLGLIGASVLKGLSSKKEYEITCITKSSIKESKKYAKFVSDDILDIKNCEILFVCTALSKTVETLEKLNEFLPKKTVVVDVASVKKDLLDKKYNFNFILSHPMAGSEKSGFSASDKNLFKGAKWLVEKKNKKLEKIIKDLGAIELKIDMKKHDYLCAQISHLPTILSFALFDCTKDESKKIASSGFRDTTRLAMTNSDLALGMFENKENIIKAFDSLIEKFNYLKNLSDDEKIEVFNAIKLNRSKMYDKNGKNIL